ncbi:hypothetical protein AVEN_48024-1 [Araneus ventricosus]|uniref:Uncharacterized protein n=1 Tax=Araneus ventricosus TaxID=182803 RepID=A0A4Y2DDL4_ARAVE|nr:hypothetical protein AVEN_48024-1 [Araneus ventricosus]
MVEILRKERLFDTLLEGKAPMVRNILVAERPAEERMSQKLCLELDESTEVSLGTKKTYCDHTLKSFGVATCRSNFLVSTTLLIFFDAPPLFKLSH